MLTKRDPLRWAHSLKVEEYKAERKIYNEQVLNFSGVHTTKEYRSPESQVSIS